MEDHGGKKGKDLVKECPTDKDNSVGTYCGSGMGKGGEQRRKNWDNCNKITFKNDLKKRRRF